MAISCNLLRFLGIDIAGAENSWVCELVWEEDKKRICWLKPPYKIEALSEIVNLIKNKDFICCAIDAPLSFSPQTKKWRWADIELRCLLEKDIKNWVQSPNSMQAVPLRAQQLASLMLPYVGAIIETHPRSSLFFMLTEKSESLKKYKSSFKYLRQLTNKVFTYVPQLLNIDFAISPKEIKTDGALDALICALIAFLYIKRYHLLYKLSLGEEVYGFGPFYIFAPSSKKKISKLKYIPGNLGDVLKHSWLLTIADELLKKTTYFRYVDTFCGFPIYQTSAKVVLYFEEKLKTSFLYKLQRPYLQNCQYAGSAHLIKLLCRNKKKPYSVDFYDKNPQAVKAYEIFLQRSALALKDGYEILTKPNAYDLIFLDPYDDFWEVWEKIMPNIIKKQRDSSILLFISYKPNERRYMDLLQFLKETKAKYLIKELISPICVQECGYFFSVLFFPQKGLSISTLDILKHLCF